MQEFFRYFFGQGTQQEFCGEEIGNTDGSAKEEFPDARIVWDVPFQKTAYSNDITRLSLQTLSDEDLDRLEALL